MTYQERYSPYFLAANTTFTTTGSGIGGFLCTTSGTLTVTSRTGAVIVSAFPVTAGVYHPMPFYTQSGAVVSLAGGASGTLGVQ